MAQQPPEPIPLFRWTEGPIVHELELVELVPPFALTGGLWACDRLRELVALGAIGRTGDTVAKWIYDPSESAVTHNRRRTMFDQAMALLNGRKLEAANDAFIHAYYQHIRNDPGVEATKLVVHGIYGGAKNGRVLRLPALLAPGILAALDWAEDDGGVSLS